MSEQCTTTHAAVRGLIDRWFSDQRLTPRLMGEFDDGALMKAFGQAGAGFFPGPAVLADEIHSRYNTPCVGRVEEIHESFWAITAERRISHPSMATIIDSARTALTPDLSHQHPGTSASPIGDPHASKRKFDSPNERPRLVVL